MTGELGVGEDLHTMLTFYHDLGRIVYFGRPSSERRVLNDLVVLDPQWPINIFKGVITIADPETMVCNNVTSLGPLYNR